MIEVIILTIEYYIGAYMLIWLIFDIQEYFEVEE
jgi:hypothetical protein